MRILPYGAIETILPCFQRNIDFRIEKIKSAILGPSRRGQTQRAHDSKLEFLSVLLGPVSDPYEFSLLLDHAIRCTPSFVELLLCRGASLTHI